MLEREQTGAWGINKDHWGLKNLGVANMALPQAFEEINAQPATQKKTSNGAGGPSPIGQR